MLRQRSVCREVIMVVSNRGGLIAAVNAVKNLDKLGRKNDFLVMNDERVSLVPPGRCCRRIRFMAADNEVLARSHWGCGL